MGLFGGKKQAPEPVRRDEVLKLIKLGMRERDESDRDIDLDRREYAQARDQYDAAVRKATLAERRAAHEALRRHGY